MPESKKSFYNSYWFYGILALVVILYKIDLTKITKNEEAKYNLSSYTLQSDYRGNEAAANKKYLDQTITVRGMVTKIADTYIILEYDIACHFESSGSEVERLSTLSVGDVVTIKGECKGQGLMNVQMEYCSISKLEKQF